MARRWLFDGLQEVLELKFHTFEEKAGTAFPDPAQLCDELNAPFRVTEERIAFYNENGYIKLKHALSASLLEHYPKVISQRVAEHSNAVPMEERTVAGKAFLQIMNFWVESPEVKEFVFGKRLARIAADLTGTLAFCEKSHRFQFGRDLELSEESEMTLKQAPNTFDMRQSSFDLSDVSFHAGWTFHRAGADSTERQREVMTII